MAKRFTRNITDTVLTGKNQEPLNTNIQNDLLSDDTHVYVRNGNKYDCLTNSITNITSKDKSVKITKKDRSVDLSVIGGGGGGPSEEYKRVVKLKPSSEYMEIDLSEESTDMELVYDVGISELELTIKLLEEKIKNLENHLGVELGFLGNVVDIDFEYYRDNTEVLFHTMSDYAPLFMLDKRYTKDIGYTVITFGKDYTPDYLQLNSMDTMYSKPSLAINYTFELRNNSPKNIPVNISNGHIGIPIYENKLQYQNGDITVKPNSITKFQITIYRDENEKVLFTFIQELAYTGGIGIGG